MLCGTVIDQSTIYFLRLTVLLTFFFYFCFEEEKEKAIISKLITDLFETFERKAHQGLKNNFIVFVTVNEAGFN